MHIITGTIAILAQHFFRSNLDVGQMNVVVLLEWNFSPPGYFETRKEIKKDDYTIVINGGKAVATIDSAVYDANPSIRDTLDEELHLRFRAVQLVNHKAYELSSPPTPTRIYPDGHKLISLEGEIVTVSAGEAEFQVSDKEGTVVVDTKRDRIKKYNSLADLLIKHKDDKVLMSLSKSYTASVNDPENEFIYLYEMLEAMEHEFKGRKAVLSALREFGLSSADLKHLGKLTNEPTLRQSRHRGNSGGTLRDATEAELSKVRVAAETMIKAYLEYLEKKSPD